MASPLAEFEPVLRAFLGADNTARTAANQYLVQLRNSQPDTLLLSLLQALRQSADVTLRQLAAVLIRKSLFEDEQHVWSRTSKEVQGVVKAELLNAVQNEQNDQIRRMTCDTIGDVAKMILYAEEWPGVLQAVFTWTDSTDYRLRSAGFTILYSLAMYVAEKLQAQFPVLVTRFEKTLADASCPNVVKVEALRAAGSVVVCVDHLVETKPFQKLVPGFTGMIHHMLTSNDHEGAFKSLSAFIDIADSWGRFWQPHVSTVVPAMLSIAGTRTYPDNVRQLAMEFCITLASKAGPMVRKLPNQAFLKTTLPVLFGMMLEVDTDLARWDAKDAPANRPCNNFNVGREGLQRVGEAIGHHTFIPIAFAIINNFLTKSEWVYKHAALMALSEFTYLLPDDHVEGLTVVADQVLPHTADADPRVQYAALNALGMLCTDQHPVIQLHRHETIVPAIQACMKSKSARVRAHAAGALVNFLEGSFDMMMAPYVDTLLADLYTLLSTGPVMVQEHAMNALTVLADTCGDEFGRFYDKLMPVLRGMISRCHTDKALRRLRGRTFECIGIIGSSVPVAKFKPDAVEVMRTMVTEQSKQMDAADPQRSSMWTTWGRIGSALKGDFATYLPSVMPALLVAAAETPMVKRVSRADLAAAGDGSDSDDSELEQFGDGDHVLQVRTAALDDKSEAVNIIKCFADSLGATFYPYVSQSAGVLLPILKLEGIVYDDVKGAALSTLSSLIQCANDALKGSERAMLPTLLNGILSAIFESMTAAAKSDMDIEMLNTFVQSIKSAIDAACVNPQTEESKAAAKAAGVAAIPSYTPLLNKAQLTEVTKRLAVQMQEAFNRRAVRRAEATVDPEDFDLEEQERVEQLDAQEHQLHFYCVDTISSLFKTHRGAYLQVFEEVLMDKILHMCDPACISEDQKHGIFVIDDVLEFGDAGAAKHLPRFVKILSAGAAHDAPAVAQAAVYGLGVAAVTMGPAFAPFANDAVQTLAKVINKFAESSKSHERLVHDNAMTAMGKIMGTQTVEHLTDLVAFWLSRLPLEDDKSEGRVAIRQLCARIEAKCAATLLPVNLHAALQVFADVVGSEDLCTESLALLIMNALRQVHAAVPAATLGDVWGKLPAEAQGVLGQFMADPRVGGGSPVAKRFTGAGAGAGAGNSRGRSAGRSGGRA